jgi:hypothetical protein
MSRRDLCNRTGLPIVPIRWVLVRDPLGRFTPQALLCTTLEQSPEQVLRWFVQRWQLEVTFEETRAHLGIETQRQWSDRAIARTTLACSACSLWSPCWPPGSAPPNAEALPSAPGIVSVSRPSATRWPSCVAISGANRVS